MQITRRADRNSLWEDVNINSADLLSKKNKSKLGERDVVDQLITLF